ncbi:MAG: hypothetical protein AAF216_06910 [Pseudomonadota bacterium]
MTYLLGYIKLMLLLGATAALYPLLHVIWVGALPANLMEVVATLAVLAVFGLLVTLISLPGRPPADKQPTA